MLNRWRLPMPRLWAALADGLTDPGTLVRWHAAEVLATGRAAVRPHIAALLDAVERDESMTGLHAAVALARLGDTRFMPALARSIATVLATHHRGR